MDPAVRLNGDVLMPLIGLGTYKIHGQDVVDEVIGFALNIGYRSFDTAAVYNNEEAIGRALKRYLPENNLHREDIFVTTKLSPDDHGTERCAKAFSDSLKKLDMDYVDLYLIHWPGVQGRRHDDASVPNLRRESWLQLEKFHSEGKTKAIGVSNYTIKHLEELITYCSVKPAVLQVEYHPHLVQSELLQFCFDHDIHLQAYSSLGTSTSDNQLLNDEVVKETAEKYKVSPAQILLRWALEQKIGVIPKSVHPKYIESNFKAADFHLSMEDVNRLSARNKNVHYCWNPKEIN